MTQSEIIMCADASGISLYGMGKDREKFIHYLEAFAKLVTQHERERIKQANAPEIEKVNAHIKKLEDAVLAEREACAQVCEEQYEYYGHDHIFAKAIRARGQA